MDKKNQKKKNNTTSTMQNLYEAQEKQVFIEFNNLALCTKNLFSHQFSQKLQNHYCKLNKNKTKEFKLISIYLKGIFL